MLASVKTGNTIEVLEQIRAATAEEAASLKWERMQRPLDPEAPKWSSRRVALLAEVARLTLVIARLQPGRPAPGTTAKVIQAFWITVRETASEVLSKAEVDQLIAGCATEVEKHDLHEFEAWSGLNASELAPHL